ncbi:MAG TPA: aminotransferase class IV, partial [Bacteroidales bacterium]|nr:aminotransferase class IV [Bacteroidales bacterium]
MCQLIETIQIQNGIPINISYHQKRMDKSIYELFNTKNTISLVDVVNVPPHAKKGTWKCRIVYTTNILEISYNPYVYRTINTLKIVEATYISYPHKYLHREIFQKLLNQKNNADEILITKQGYITDTSYTNIIFFDGREWFTPQTYLLPGTQRAYLLEQKLIREKPIHINTIHTFSKARLINCFLNLEVGNDIPIENIYI